MDVPEKTIEQSGGPTQDQQRPPLVQPQPLQSILASSHQHENDFPSRPHQRPRSPLALPPVQSQVLRMSPASYNVPLSGEYDTKASSGDYANLASSSSRELWESGAPSLTLEDPGRLYEGNPVDDRDRGNRGIEGVDRDTERDARRDSRRLTSYHDTPLPPLPRVGSDIQVLRRARTADTHASSAPLIRPRSEIDWIVPVEEKRALRPKTVGERLQPTIDIAIQTRDGFARKAMYTGYILNFAIGLQVLIGSLTTGLPAVARNIRQLAIQTMVLGGITTIIAGYLARARGSNEPELSTSRVKDLDNFIRAGTAFILDFGHLDDPKNVERVDEFRREFEELLGNGSGERKLAPNV